MQPLERVLLASSNRGKLDDFRRLLKRASFELVAAADAGVTVDVEETGATFEENARIKACAVTETSGMPALGDDSGLCVEALGGRPGIFSARYAGPDCDDHANNEKLLGELAGETNRRAAFVCVLVLTFPDGSEVVAEGRCEGTISSEERGPHGFGYDPVFFCADLGGTFGEASPEEKNARSHRGAAVRALLCELARRGSLR